MDKSLGDSDGSRDKEGLLDKGYSARDEDNFEIGHEWGHGHIAASLPFGSISST